MQNFIDIYVNAQGDVVDVINLVLKGEGINSDVNRYITPLSPAGATNSVVFNFDGSLPSQEYVLINSGETLPYEVSPNVFENWNVYYFPVPQEISSISVSTWVKKLFTQMRYRVFDDSDSDFLGVVNIDPNLGYPSNLPIPAEGNYVRVLDTSTDWEYLSAVWVDSGTQIATLDVEIPSVPLQELTITGAITGIPKVILGDEGLILQWIAQKLNITDAQVLYLLKDIKGAYPESSIVESNDYLVIQKSNGELKSITFANIAEGTRENFIGTFNTASGLTCPDPEDLLCEWPNGIGDPDDRLGWVASVLSTGTKWSWSATSNVWIDTGLAPTLAKDIGYDPTSDASTDEENLQDAMVEHGNKINVNKTDLDAQKLKTQKLNSDGDIAEDIEVLPGKDISSTDLSTGTLGAYTAIIQAIVAEFLRNNNQDNLIGDNATDITARLVKNFSTLLNKSTPDDGDLMAIWDVTASLPKNISWAEFKNAIDTSLINDQGWYINLAALQAAHPVGEDGQHATIGDTDTRAVWDGDSNDWIEVASKLYYTVTAGNALEIRVGDNESAITAINITLGNKEDLANKVDDITGNEASVIKYLSAKGVFDYVNPQILVFQEVRKYNKAVQVGLAISRASTDTVLFDGRIDRVEIEGGIIQTPGVAQYSIDGGVTLKNIAVYDVGSSQYVNLDLAISIVSGSYFTLLFSVLLDKWLAIDSDVDLSMLRGSGWLPVMTTSGNYALINSLTLRVDNLEENQGVPALQEVQIDAPIIVTTNTIAHELIFDSESIETNEPTILDVDVNFNHVVKVNTEPGVAFQFYAQIKNQGTPGSSAISVFHIVNKSAPVTAGSFIVGKKYIINSVGTTDFTLIGASGNTIGILFTATGVGTGTGSALITFRDIRLTAVGQDIENDRYIGFSISNNDYVAPFTPGVYYTNEGVDFNILQVLFAANTIFPSGNAPSSSESTILIDSATESRNGVETKQKGHNDESVVDRKDLLETQKVVVANYQSAGQYMANKPEIVLTTNKIVRALFSGQGTDLTESVELSLDNGVTYYDVEYRETNVDLTVKNAITHVMDLYFTGVKFIATYVDSVIANDAVPYNAPEGQFELPITGVPIVIEEETSEEVEDVRGSTLSQLLINGNYGTGDITNWITDNITSVSVAAEIVSFTAIAQFGRLRYDGFNLVNGEEYFILSRIKSTSSEVALVSYNGASDISVPHSGSGNFEVLSHIITGQATVENDYVVTIRDGRTSAWDEIEVDYCIAIPTNGRTLAEMQSLVMDGYIEQGTWNAGQAKTFDQLENNLNDFGNYTLDVDTTVEKEASQDKVSYLKYTSDGSTVDSFVDIVWKPNTLYTVLVHVLENTSLIGFTSIFASSTDGDQAVTPNGEKGLFKITFNTGSTPLTTLRSFLLSTANAGEYIIVRQAILEGDHTNISDEEALRIIKDVDFGEFTRQGITYKTVAKNKFDGLWESGNISTITGEHVVDATAIRSVNYMSVLSNTDYIYSPFSGISRVYFYDSNYNYISTDGIEQFTTPTNAKYMKVRITSTDLSFELQIEIGTVATIKEDYKETFSWVDTGEDGFAMLPNGVYDDELTQRINPNYILQESDIATLTTGVNIDYVTIPVETFNNLKPQLNGAIDGSFIIDGFYVEIASGLDSVGNEYKFNTTTTSLFLAIPSGTYANLAAAQADLAGTKIQYELATPLDRTEANNNQAPIHGELFIGPRHTYEVSVPQGVLPSRWSATSGVNTKSQVKANTDSIVRLAKKLAAQGLSIEEITVELKKLADEIGYTPDLQTTAKIVVDAINELVVSIASIQNSIIDLTPVELLAAPAPVAINTAGSPNVTLTSSLALYSRIKVYSLENGKPIPAVEIRLADFVGGEYFYVTPIINETNLGRFMTKYRITYGTTLSITADLCTIEAVTFGSPPDIPVPLTNNDVTITSILAYK